VRAFSIFDATTPRANASRNAGSPARVLGHAELDVLGVVPHRPADVVPAAREDEERDVTLDQRPDRLHADLHVAEDGDLRCLRKAHLPWLALARAHHEALAVEPNGRALIDDVERVRLELRRERAGSAHRGRGLYRAGIARVPVLAEEERVRADLHPLGEVRALGYVRRAGALVFDRDGMTALWAPLACAVR
jgi:hypothetical protein